MSIGLSARLLLFLCCVVVTSGCRTWESIPVTSVHERIAPGDFVEVTTTDELQYRFVVRLVEPDSVVGAEREIALGDILRLRRRVFSFGRTAGIVGIGFGVAAAGVGVGYLLVLLAGG